jgi:hypothetical protein
MNNMDYSQHDMHMEGEGAPIEYAKFTGVILGILILAWVYTVNFAPMGLTAESYMRGFMGVFFLVFGGFKLLDLRGFVMSYIGYDIIARRSKTYAYLYPFVELGLGVGYLFGSQYLDWVTLILMIIGAIGVFQQLLLRSQIKCACLGTYIKLPLTSVSLIEDLVMAAMALWFIL